MLGAIPVSDPRLLPGNADTRGPKPTFEAGGGRCVQRLFLQEPEQMRSVDDGKEVDKTSRGRSSPAGANANRFPIRRRVLLPRMQMQSIAARSPIVVPDSSESEDDKEEAPA